MTTPPNMKPRQTKPPYDQPAEPIDSIKNVKDTDVGKLSEDLRFVIEIATERIHYAETRRNTFATIAGTLIAAGIALATFIIGIIRDTNVIIPFIIFSVMIFITGTIVLLVFSRQTNFNYPFTKATST